MEKIERNTNRSIIALNITFIIVIIVLVFAIFKVYSKLEVEVKLNSEYEEKIEEKKESYSVINNNKIELEEKFNNLENIDSMTDSVKDEVFKLALELENKIIKKETDYKIAYLTFDDGPYYSTNDFLKVLKENDVKATFFTIGLNKERCYDNQLKECHSLYKKIVLDGHTIANHTYSHQIFNGLYSSSTSFINQVVKQEEFIKEEGKNKSRFIKKGTLILSNSATPGIPKIMGIDASQLSIKAKTNEQMDAVGEKFAIEASAVVMLRKDN